MMDWALTACLMTITYIYYPANALNPICLVPGLASSALNAMIAQNADISLLCQSLFGGPVRIYLDENYLLTHPVTCVFQALQCPIYNSTTHTTSNRREISVSTDFTLDSVAALDEEMLILIFNPMIDFLSLKFGYVRNVSIFGAPYDFRKGPREPEVQAFCIQFQQLIIHAYTTNQNQKVILIYHSMGSVMVRFCLRGYTQQFKDKYILILISLAGVIGGALKIVDILTGVRFYGTEFGPSIVGSSNISLINIPFLQPLLGKIPTNLASVQVVPAYTVLNWTQNPWLSPSEKAFGNATLVQTLTKNYTAANLRQYYEDLGGPTLAQIYDDAYPYIANQPPTGVKMYCFYGTGIPTISTIHHAGATPNSPKLLPSNGDGDGLVNVQGSNCEILQGNHSIQMIQFKYVNHNDFLFDPDVYNTIANIITKESTTAQ